MGAPCLLLGVIAWEGLWPPSDLQHSSGLGDDPELPSSHIHVETQGRSHSVSEENALCC